MTRFFVGAVRWFSVRWPLLVCYILFALIVFQTAIIVCPEQPILGFVAICFEALGYRVCRRVLLARLDLVEVPTRWFGVDPIGHVIDRIFTRPGRG